MLRAAIDRRSFLLAVGSAAVVAALGTNASARAETRILAITYEGNPLDPNGDHLSSNLAGPGVVVTSVRGAFYGRLAQELDQAAYDQVWVADWTSHNFAFLNATDRVALATWFASHQSVVLDGRSGGIWFDNDASERGLSRNIVSNLTAKGGGLWIGAKQGPDFEAANKYLETLGFNPFVGAFFDVGALTGSQNPLLTNPNQVNVDGLGWQAAPGSFSRSAAPTGPQPNGLTLQTVVSDSHGNPLITTNIPEPPGAGFLGGLGAGLLGWTRRRRP